MKVITQCMLMLLFVSTYSCKEEEKTDIIKLTKVVTNVSAFGKSDGAIDLTIEGGKVPFTFVWSNGANTEDLSDIPSGNYFVTVTDADGQNKMDTAFVAEPDSLSISINKLNTSATGLSDGSIDLTVSGGVSPYAYAWSNNSTEEDQTAIPAGKYYITVTDANSMAKSDSVFIADPLAVSGQITNVSFYSGGDGKIELNITGGTEPISYLWSTGGKNNNISNRAAGEYAVTVTDAEMTEVTKSFTIIEPDQLFETITFPSLDSLEITADLYNKSDDLPVILMCHMDGSSRGEYRKTAAILYDLGYNCMAIDQRRGTAKNSVANITAQKAAEKGLPTDYIDALQDIQAAVNYLYNKYNKEIIILASSYSCGLSFKITLDDDHILALAAFSIYYDFIVNDLNLNLSDFTKPIFVTSEKSLISSQVQKVYDAVSSEEKTIFTPSKEGAHGGDALNSSIADEYWTALKDFLNSLK